MRVAPGGAPVGTVGPRTQRIVYGDLTDAAVRAELAPIADVDLAHVLMLAGRDLIDADAAASLLRAILDLRARDFAPLVGLPAPRGAYLMYENHLRCTTGDDVGGLLHTGRSRNDLKATVTAMRLRDWVLAFAAETNRLIAVLLSRARAHRDVVMPVYTHFQAAMPSTYGHYLTGVAHALNREVAALAHAAGGLARCPLGAGAGAGSDLPLDANFMKTPAASDVGKRASIYSFHPNPKVNTSALFRQMVDSIPAGHTAFLVPDHEADGMVRRGQLTPAEYTAIMRSYGPIVRDARAHEHPHVYLVMNLDIPTDLQ